MRLKWAFLGGLIIAMWGVNALIHGHIWIGLLLLVLSAAIIAMKGIERPKKAANAWKFMLIGNKNDEMQASMNRITPGEKINYDWDPATDKFIARTLAGTVIGYFPSQANKILELSPGATVGTIGLDDNRYITIIAEVKKI